jgi:hypothetical protein
MTVQNKKDMGDDEVAVLMKTRSLPSYAYTVRVTHNVVIMYPLNDYFDVNIFERFTMSL